MTFEIVTKFLVNIYQKIRYNFLQRHVYGITASFRVLPDFMVIGFGKAGTTTLYHYLGKHPCIIKSSHDHLGFFDSNFKLGLNFYKSFFPTRKTKNEILKKYGKFLTYDVTASYIKSPLCAKQIIKTLPKIKLIIICRNPADVAYSYFNGDTRLSKKISFEEAIEKEIKIHETKIKKSKEFPLELLENSFLARGIYFEQLKIWSELFQKDQLLFIKTEDLEKDPIRIFNDIFEFLDLPKFTIKNFEKQNVGKYPPMKKETRKILIDFYKLYNKKFQKLIDNKFGWDEFN